ncbi:MAG TPA: hypothetical protein DCQ26_05300 [Marinilabiliales bacterium]|nr:MAG: hypothetical protein A2W84_19055 [Bacteroidetes bacterium GWC2_40_13]OFX73944.1 MAG: hypothetical protein A2W96_11530 [Bacteroidetes bacterium GWD2_40_43]OFX93222.1 MAG: hypothetical protein A2W97_06540 [Bacteroidetes bacterium GWE2_40_63]OFY21592.1 MAG: hypothetical protein A2W88_10540 [Bacteroidetes bacterium GWF2_40_13]OFZ24244.1 MAG: hypothetical protein A2437_17675 [Bacteroidetes bacterium RIFOXYC2_FULL_40_12]HAM98005.1 hypothetical protein [Marinilabiliales bacterium]
MGCPNFKTFLYTICFFTHILNTMALKRIITICFLICPFIGLFAQPAYQLKYEFFAGVGATNLMADISAPKSTKQLVWVKIFNTVGVAGNAGLRYNIANRHYASVNLALGQLYAEDPTGDPKYWSDGRKSSTFFTEFTSRYEFLAVKERQRRTVYKMLGESMLKNFNLPTYFFIGVGGLYNIGTFAQLTEDRSNRIPESYSNFALVIPYGVGFKTRLTRLSYLNVEVGMRFAFSDKIDNRENGWYDQYQFITVNYVKKLRSTKNGLPKFR